MKEDRKLSNAEIDIYYAGFEDGKDKREKEILEIINKLYKFKVPFQWKVEGNNTWHKGFGEYLEVEELIKQIKEKNEE